VVQAQSAELSATRIQEIAGMLSDQPAGVGRPCSDRKSWEPLAAHFAPQVKHAEAFLEQPFPAWDDNAYLDFTRSGSRARGEKMMHSRQNWLHPLVIAECVEGKGRFIPPIAMVLDELSKQKSWTIPAHDAQLESFSGRHYFVELNSADLAHTVAESLYLLGDKLPPATRKRALDALDVRIFKPMRDSFRSGQGNDWLTVQSNWNAVCLKGVTGAALAVLPDRNDRALFVAAAEHYSSFYLMPFRDDGYGLEGMGYWNYGFAHYSALREMLWSATNGRIDLFGTPKVRNIALFGFRFPMSPHNMASFGDAPPGTAPKPDLLLYLSRVFGFKSSDPGIPGIDQSSAAERPEDVTTDVLAAFPNHASEIRISSAQATDEELHTFFPASDVLVSRSTAANGLNVTIKAGGNTTHSHNDIGSYAIGLDAAQPVADPGGPRFYTADTFSKNRLASRLLNSFGHPVPEIGGRLQLNATKVTIPPAQTTLTEKQDAYMVDMTNAYDAPQLIRLTRTMRHSRGGDEAVEIEDHFEFKEPTDIVESLPTHGTWKRTGDKTIEFSEGGYRLRAVLDAPGAIDVAETKVEDYGNPFTRVGVTVHMGKAGEVKIRFTRLQ
jgi:hypothetical protein